MFKMIYFLVKCRLIFKISRGISLNNGRTERLSRVYQRRLRERR